jgi:transposase
MADLRPCWRSHEEELFHGGADHRGAQGADAGAKPGHLARKHGISEHTFYRWKAKYGGMSVSEAQRLKQLEDENRRLKARRLPGPRLWRLSDPGLVTGGARSSYTTAFTVARPGRLSLHVEIDGIRSNALDIRLL